MSVQIILRNPIDRDARDYIAQAGVTDADAKRQIQDFVRGVKALGIWGNMVCWPMRSEQNAGTGTTVFSMGGMGRYDGTIVNGATWGSDGITVNNSNQVVRTTFSFASPLTSILTVVAPDSADAGSGDRYSSSDDQGTSNGLGFDDLPAGQFRILRPSLLNAGTRADNTLTAFGVGLGAGNTFWFQDGSITLGSDIAYRSPASKFHPVGASLMQTALGVYAFSIALDGILASGVLDGLYSLYKNTLGRGLVLP